MDVAPWCYKVDLIWISWDGWKSTGVVRGPIKTISISKQSWDISILLHGEKFWQQIFPKKTHKSQQIYNFCNKKINKKKTKRSMKMLTTLSNWARYTRKSFIISCLNLFRKDWFWKIAFFPKLSIPTCRHFLFQLFRNSASDAAL